jgi:hypothetical protein
MRIIKHRFKFGFCNNSSVVIAKMGKLLPSLDVVQGTPIYGVLRHIADATPDQREIVHTEIQLSNIVQMCAQHLGDATVGSADGDTNNFDAFVSIFAVLQKASHRMVALDTRLAGRAGSTDETDDDAESRCLHLATHGIAAVLINKLPTLKTAKMNQTSRDKLVCDVLRVLGDIVQHEGTHQYFDKKILAVKMTEELMVRLCTCRIVLILITAQFLLLRAAYSERWGFLFEVPYCCDARHLQLNERRADAIFCGNTRYAQL